MTQEAFRRLPIPAPEILTQPPDHVTLINIETNIFTAKKPDILSTRVLGQVVRVRATPASFVWEYGDGDTLATANPGHRYPYMPTAHTYTQPGTFRIGLVTTFTGEFSVSGGPWQPINGTATRQSTPVTVTAEERRAVLIS